MSVDAFCKAFIADGAAYGIDAYNIEMGEQDVSVTEWTAGEAGEQKRTMDMVINLRGIPLIKSAKCHKKQTLTTTTVQGATRVEYYTIGAQPEIPYGDSFFVHDRWVLRSTSDQGRRCVLRVFGRVEFVKNPFFKSKIEKGGIDGLHEYLRNWTAAIGKRGYLTEAKQKKKGKLAHEVEKSNQEDLVAQPEAPPPKEPLRVRAWRRAKESAQRCANLVQGRETGAMILAVLFVCLLMLV